MKLCTTTNREREMPKEETYEKKPQTRNQKGETEGL